MTPPGLRFWLLLGPLVLALCAGYAAAVLFSATWEEARALDAIFPFYGKPIRAFSAAEWDSLRRGLTLMAGGLGSTVLLQLLQQRSRREFAALMCEIKEGAQKSAAGFRGLRVGQRRQAATMLVFLTALRLYFSFTSPAYDDAVSYVVFVSEGWLATSAYYPIPNNHVLSNTLSQLFYQIHHGFWWSMRLPVLLVCTSATLLLFAGLRRWGGFRVAMFATALFGVLEISLYHAAAGRGYWLFIGLAILVFFSTLVLSEAGAGHRAAWAVLLIAGALGCYTIPTFVFVLASAFSWLGLTYWRRCQYAQLAHLGIAGILTGLAAVALYAPLLFISGYEKLGGNGFVAPLAAAKFWQELPAYIWFTEGSLAGQRTLGAVLTLLVLASTGWLLYLSRTNRLPDGPANRLYRLAAPALWFMALPYALLLVRRVFAPERVLMYKSLFFFILVALLVDWTLTRWPAPKYRWPRPALAAVAILFTTYQVVSMVRVSPIVRYRNEQYRAGMQWLAAQPPGLVLAPETSHNLLLRFYALSDFNRSWRMDSQQRPKTQYAYVVALPKARGLFQPRFPFPPAYHNSQLDIYALPPHYRLNTQPWLRQPSRKASVATVPQSSFQTRVQTTEVFKTSVVYH